jgi:hypothetical protein
MLMALTLNCDAPRSNNTFNLHVMQRSTLHDLYPGSLVFRISPILLCSLSINRIVSLPCPGRSSRPSPHFPPTNLYDRHILPFTYHHQPPAVSDPNTNQPPNPNEFSHISLTVVDFHPHVVIFPHRIPSHPIQPYLAPSFLHITTHSRTNLEAPFPLPRANPKFPTQRQSVQLHPSRPLSTYSYMTARRARTLNFALRSCGPMIAVVRVLLLHLLY